METKTLVIAVAALIIGLGGGYVLADSGRPASSEHAMHGSDMGMSGAMDEMRRSLEGKAGDEFDKAFLSEMIMHHQGAVEMAEAALENAEHEEIKTMANAIISAQTTEIRQMQDWQRAWYSE